MFNAKSMAQRRAFSNVYKNYVNGQWVASTSKRLRLVDLTGIDPSQCSLGILKVHNIKKALSVHPNVTLKVPHGIPNI